MTFTIEISFFLDITFCGNCDTTSFYEKQNILRKAERFAESRMFYGKYNVCMCKPFIDLVAKFNFY